MKTFHLQIVTPDGEFFDGQAERVIVRTNNGDVAIMAGHANYVAVLGIGAAVVVTENERKKAACMGGMLAVTNGEVRVIATAFEWADQIDKERGSWLWRKQKPNWQTALSPRKHVPLSNKPSAVPSCV